MTADATSSATPSNSEEFVLSRTFKAPRELVFKAWTEPEHLAKWWGPKGMEWGGCSLDLRPGGIFHYLLKGGNGFEMWGKFTYREIIVPEKLVYILSFSDPAGGITRHPMSATWPLQMLNTVTFAEEDGRTTVTIRILPVDANDEELKTFEDGRESMKHGFGGSMNELEAYLATL